jgi:asparagine synthase (glutamine-hydrolysing)
MSGVCGIVNLDGAPVDPELLRKMAEASAYRGLDGIDYWIDGNVGFAHLALHTTPESLRERQPLFNPEGNIVLTADARVDNRDEMIRTLTAKGYLQDKDPTDADLILAAYECWGEACPEQIIGDFAFAIWDAPEQRLFCARDAVGARTFCYHIDNQTLRFGSDVRQVLADERVSRDLDGYFISDFLASNGRYQSRTVFAVVQKLLPGHCLIVDNGEPRAWRYWNPDRNPPIRYRTDVEYVDHFRDLLFRCVAGRLRSVKGAAAILTSGGLDSPSVAAIAQALYTSGQTLTQPVAYTHVFDTLTECDEREYSLSLPAETGIEFHQIQAEEFWFLDDEAAYAPVLDGPMVAHESLYRHAFQQAQGRGCDVVMSGWGGDHLFVAADHQAVDHARGGRWWRLWPWLIAGRQQGRSWPGLIHSLVLWPLLPRQAQYRIDRWRGSMHFRHLPDWIHPELQEKTRPAERFYQQGYPRCFRSDVRQEQYERFVGLIGLTFLMEWWTVKPFEYGLETRFPLLDRRLADFVLAAPLDLGARPGKGNNKWLLRQAAAGIVPEKIRCRKDRANWGKYMEYVMHQARHALRALFADTQMTQHQLVNDQALLDAFDAYCEGNREYGCGNGYLFPASLERWLQTYATRVAAIRFKPLAAWQLEQDDDASKTRP